MSRAVPIFAGSCRRQTATQLAEAALEHLAVLPRYTRHKKPRSYGVGLDVAGRVVIDHPDAMPAAELLMVCTYASDPDELADNIRDECASRDGGGR